MPGGIGNYQQIDGQDFDFKNFHKQVKGKEPFVYVILVNEPKLFFRKVRKQYETIHAAGGIVINEENEYLFIFRKGKWDLPKGKLDEGEKTKKAAVREVEEECGISVQELGTRLCKTWHVYEERGQVVFKKTSWYNMKAPKQELIPQLEEGITEARWIAPGDFSVVKANTYPLINDVIGLIEVN